MSSNSGIQWTTHTFNPWWGCIKVAQGCKHCYAEGVATRFYGRKVWGPNSERKIASAKVWNDPQRWNRAASNTGERAKVFCLSMGDVLEDHPALVEPRKRLVGIIESTPFLDWQLLTKRPENAEMFGWGASWPVNVWFGTSAAIQSELNANMPHLFRVPAAIRFLSLEPLIGPMDFAKVPDEWDRPSGHGAQSLLGDLDWVIVGGESGKGARPCHIEWVRSIMSQCRAADVACFVKQLGAYVHWNGCQGGYLDGPSSVWPRETGSHQDGAEFRQHLIDPKGGDWMEWPEDLRVRDFPARAAKGPQ